MKYFLMLAVLLGSMAGATITINSAAAESISNPKCRDGLRETMSKNGYHAFAMTPGGAHCGWTIQSSSSQAEANRAAMHYCKSRPGGQNCRIVWPN